MEQSCDDSDDDCQRACRYGCCEDEDDTLCNTSEERLCRTKCFVKEKCDDDDDKCLSVSIYPYTSTFSVILLPRHEPTCLTLPSTPLSYLPASSLSRPPLDSNRNVDQNAVRFQRVHPPPTSPSSAILKARSAADKSAMKGKDAVATTRIAEQRAENNAAMRTMISRKAETMIIHRRRHRLHPGRRPCVMALRASNEPALHSCVFPSLAMLVKCTRMARSMPIRLRAKLCSGFFLRMSGFCALLTALLNNGIS